MPTMTKTAVSSKTAAALTQKVAAMSYAQRIARLNEFPAGELQTPEQALEYLKLAIGAEAEFIEE